MTFFSFLFGGRLFILSLSPVYVLINSNRKIMISSDIVPQECLLCRSLILCCLVQPVICVIRKTHAGVLACIGSLLNFPTIISDPIKGRPFVDDVPYIWVLPVWWVRGSKCLPEWFGALFQNEYRESILRGSAFIPIQDFENGKD